MCCCEGGMHSNEDLIHLEPEAANWELLVVGRFVTELGNPTLIKLLAWNLTGCLLVEYWEHFAEFKLCTVFVGSSDDVGQHISLFLSVKCQSLNEGEARLVSSLRYSSELRREHSGVCEIEDWFCARSVVRGF
ncbi:hypothetical protein Droror1_Dr00000102 [Drosera rotundifolia]